MRLRPTLGSIRHELRYSGLRGLAWNAVERAVRPVAQVGLESICQKDLTGPLSDVSARVEIEISPATESDVDQLVDLVKSNWDGTSEFGPYSELGFRATILDRMQRGQQCFVAKIGTDIVHYNWIAPDSEEAIAGTGLIASLAEGREAVCHDGFTVEAWRGRGIHPAVNNAMLRSLKASGYQTAYTVVGTLDRPSNITHHRLHWRFSGVMLYFISRRARRSHVWCLKGTLAPFEKTTTGAGVWRRQGVAGRLALDRTEAASVLAEQHTRGRNMVETTGSTSIEIDASPEAVYAILTDLSRISELSPECYKADWDGTSTGPVVGATFRGYNQAGDNKWDAGCVVVAADAGKEWAFEVPADDGRSTTWRYVIEPIASGSRVTESFDSPILDGEHFQKMNRHEGLLKNIARTLENLKSVAEA